MVIVDGNNVIGSVADGWWRDRPAAVRRMIGLAGQQGAATGPVAPPASLGAAEFPGADPAALVVGKRIYLYPTGGDVTIALLVAKGAVRDNEKVKVLGNGDIAVKLTVAVDKVSRSAEQKIVAAGGSIK